MKKLELTDLIPEKATFKISGTGDLEHTLRPFNLEDRAWLIRTFGDGEKLQAVFDKGDMESITRMVFHQLVDKTPFAPIEEEHWDEETGKSTGKVLVGGYRLILRAMASAIDSITVMKALLATIGISEPVMEQLTKDVEGARAAEKKRATPSNLTGKKSSTASKASTGTPTGR